MLLLLLLLLLLLFPLILLSKSYLWHLRRLGHAHKAKTQPNIKISFLKGMR